MKKRRKFKSNNKKNNKTKQTQKELKLKINRPIMRQLTSLAKVHSLNIFSKNIS